MPREKRKGSKRTTLADLWRESSQRFIPAARIILETAIIYLLFLTADWLLLGAMGLAWRAETPFQADLREGVKIFSTIAMAVGYVFHVMSSLRYQVPPSRLRDGVELISQLTSLKQIEEAYSDKVQLVDEVIKQLRQQSIKSIKK